MPEPGNQEQNLRPVYFKVVEYSCPKSYARDCDQIMDPPEGQDIIMITPRKEEFWLNLYARANRLADQDAANYVCPNHGLKFEALIARVQD